MNVTRSTTPLTKRPNTVVTAGRGSDLLRVIPNIRNNNVEVVVAHSGGGSLFLLTPEQALDLAQGILDAADYASENEVKS